MNTNKFSKIIGMATVLLLGSVSVAQANAEGLYVGAGLGSYKINAGDLDNNDSVIKALVGYQFISLLGVEGSWTDFNRVSNGNDNFKANGYGAAAVVSLPFGIFVKGGQFWWNSNAVLNNTQQDSNGSDPFWGAGFRFGLSNHFALRLEAERYDVQSTHLYTYTAGVDYKF